MRTSLPYENENGIGHADLTGANLTSMPKCGERDFDRLYAFWQAALPSATLLDGQLPGPRSDRNRPGSNNLAGVNLAGQNLTNATSSARHADQREFQPGQPHGIDFADVDLPIDFDHAIWRTPIRRRQLYSTASYQAHDLTGIELGRQQPGRRATSPARTSLMQTLSDAIGDDGRSPTLLDCQLPGSRS